MKDNVDFISTGSADVHTEYLDIRQISELCSSSESTVTADDIVSTLTQILYGISQDRTVVMQTSGQSRILAGHKFVNVIHSFLSSGICYDSWNGRFLDRTSSKYCLPAKMLISPIESAKLRDAVSRLCPDKPDSIRDAIFANLNNCNRVLSGFRHPVCYIDCDESLSVMFSDLFKNS
jgi:hypothetical protein